MDDRGHHRRPVRVDGIRDQSEEARRAVHRWTQPLGRAAESQNKAVRELQPLAAPGTAQVVLLERNRLFFAEPSQKVGLYGLVRVGGTGDRMHDNRFTAKPVRSESTNSTDLAELSTRYLKDLQRPVS